MTSDMFYFWCLKVAFNANQTKNLTTLLARGPVCRVNIIQDMVIKDTHYFWEDHHPGSIIRRIRRMNNLEITITYSRSN